MGFLRKNTLSKELKEALKTLSYLARAEKYYDLELDKKGRLTKPLLQVIDVIEPLRQIADASVKLEKGKTDIDGSARLAFSRADEIAELAKDILDLNPRVLVTSDKAILAKLPDYLIEAKMLYAGARTQETAAPVTAPVASAEPEIQIVESVVVESVVVDEEPADATESAPVSAPVAEEPKVAAPVAETVQDLSNVEFEVEKPKVISITKSKKTAKETAKEAKEAAEKYFATSYAGMNLQEAADIIEALASSKANLGLVLIEHASEVRPVQLGKEIVADLRALAPVADSFENGIEIENKKPLAILKDSDRLITICRDIASLSIDGFDKRKQKLLDKFVPQDLVKITELAKVGYPEVFTSTDASGESISDYLYDLADLLQGNSRELDDELFARALSQIVVQVAQYAEINSLKFKFDIITKKNKLTGKVKEMEKRHEIAILRSMTFIPQIARQVKELEASQAISGDNRDLIDQTLELLQLAYIHARENYTAAIGEFLKKAA